MFSFAGVDGMEMIASSGPVAKMAGETFVGNMNDVSSASAGASNNLPAMAGGELGLGN